MAQISYRANLSSAIFPMTLARAGRSVIIPGPDQNFDRRVDPQGEQKDAGIPQVIYMENVLPTSNGYQSVGYRSAGNLPPTGIPGVTNTLLNVTLGSPWNTPITLAIGAAVVSYYNSGVWTVVPVVGVAPSSADYLSTGTVTGLCYVHGGARLYKLEYLLGVLTLTEITASVLPAGFMTGVTGICSSFNYLIAFKSDGTVYWSSTLSAIDFQPSLITGSGSTTPGNLVGQAEFVVSSPFGFYLLTERIIIAATYTGNARYPWRFTPVLNSDGVGIAADVTSSATDSFPFLITASSSLLRLSKDVAASIAPEASELLKKLDYFDVFNPATNVFSVASTTAFPSAPQTKITQLFNRYVILSRGISTDRYTEAIVYDELLNRYGRFKVDHSAIFSSPASAAPGRNEIIFLDEFTGDTKVLVDVVSDIPSDQKSVLLLGKFQYVRSRDICLDYIQFECAQIPGTISPAVSNFTAHAIATLNGKTFLPAVQLTLDAANSPGDVMSYYSSTEGKNVSLLIKGAFDLCSVEMIFHLGGE